MKEAVSIPVIANGDITGPDAYRDCLAQSGADGVMIGRGAYGKPWLLKQIIDFSRDGVMPDAPDLLARRNIILAHYDAIIEHHGAWRGVRVARKHVGWYSNGMDGAANFRGVVNRLDDPDAVKRTVADFFDAAVDAEGEAPVALKAA